MGVCIVASPLGFTQKAKDSVNTTCDARSSQPSAWPLPEHRREENTLLAVSVGERVPTYPAAGKPGENAEEEEIKGLPSPALDQNEPATSVLFGFSF